MGDLFDEFMHELERRRAKAEGREPSGDGADGPDESEPGEADDDADDGAEATTTTDDGDSPEAEREEPTPLRRRAVGGQRSRGAGRPPHEPGGPRNVGGPSDGANPPSVGDLLRRMTLPVIIVAIVILLALSGAAINLWTDLIWYKSVGFDAVFWTRLTSKAGLFALGLVVSLVVLIGNLVIAGKLAPPPDPTKPGGFRNLADRLGDAQRQAEGRARMSGPGRQFGGPFGGSGSEATFAFDAGDMPDLVPIAGWLLAGFAVLLSLGVAGSLSGAWDTVLLWINRVPFSTTSAVTDPVFHRDISFYLFELPFFRFVQSVVNGLLLASLIVAGARYLVAATRGGEVFITRVRVHLAVLGGLYLLSVAFGYQLEKLELVYSNAGANAGITTGVAFTDANARFLAFDILTYISGIAGALLIAGAFTRWLWPLAMVVIIWASASLVLGTLYPEAVQRFSVDPNTFAQEQPYIANNIAMTRLSFGLTAWDKPDPYEGTTPLTAADVTAEAGTLTNARLWDYRPLQLTLDQLQTIKQYYDFYDVDTDRYQINGSLR